MKTRKNLKGRQVYVVDGLRTPFLKFTGQRGPFSAADMAVQLGKQLLARQAAPLFKKSTKTNKTFAQSIDEVILGCVMPAPEEVNIARVIALRIGCGQHVPAWTVQRNCASGMQALDTAALHIASGRSDLILAGGVEVMSRAPILWSAALSDWFATIRQAKGAHAKRRAWMAFRPPMLRPVFGLQKGLHDHVVNLSMGQTAEKIAHRFNISRQAMDAYALQSHQRLDRANKQGDFDERQTLFGLNGRIYEQDNGLRADSSLERLAGLKPVFDKPYGKVTAGNSAQITDGAALLLLASGAWVRQHKANVLGRIIDCQWAGVDPAQMGLGPVHAIAKILTAQQLTLPDIDIWEINEAFAAQVLACQAAMADEAYCREECGLEGAMGRINPERMNIDGGAISLGHPVGASGARIVLHSLHAMQRLNVQRGLASLCIGGGQGGAMLLERG